MDFLRDVKFVDENPVSRLSKHLADSSHSANSEVEKLKSVGNSDVWGTPPP